MFSQFELFLEGDVLQRELPLRAPNMYIRKKRIAHARDFQKFLKVVKCMHCSL